VEPPIEFVHYDIMSPLPCPPSPHRPHPLLTPPNTPGYDVVLDKGTFDAISLSSDPLPGSSGRRRLCEGYKQRILPLVKEEGVFVITSCNWTEEELRGWFEGPGDGDREEGGKEWEEGGVEFVFETAIKYRSFRFGGREGQNISSVCFRKRKRRVLSCVLGL
jgi:hypothetical protein